MDTEWIDGRLAAIHRGRRWIVAIDVAAAAAGLVQLLRTWGAGDVLVVSAAPGVGESPSDTSVFYTGTSGSTIMEGFRSFFAALESPSADLQAAVERFDPAGQAKVIAPPFATQPTLLGRSVHGARRPEWAALEDKMVVDALWEAAGIQHVPVELVAVGDAPAAAERLASEQGTVWVADNSRGWHGGAEYTRWVARPDAHAAMVAWFAQRSDRVRVMPFLDGIPCSIHGYVTGEGIAAFRPVEMVILRRMDDPGFIYAGASTSWDPPAIVRAEMRDAARTVAEHLAHHYGYLGAFSIDGVCTALGFRPTELNPRVSAGLGIQAACAEVSIGTITRGLIAGEIDVDAAFLEERIVAAADETRVAGMGLPVMETIAAERIGLTFGSNGAELAPIADADANVEVGPAPAGSYIRMRCDTSRIRIGESIAPLAAAAVRFLAGRWQFEFPPIEPAPDLCAG